jgi:hypothetical protein
MQSCKKLYKEWPMTTTIAHERFWHKFFKKLFCQNFEILFIIAPKIINKLGIQIADLKNLP